MDFKNIPKRYRPIPFWSWNEKLDADETVRQINLMDDVGIGGFFMHARGGLQTEYMGDEWFENIEAAADAAEKNRMGAWAYDENGWPSGFGNGIVNGLGIEYQQKYLRMSDTEPEENLICKCGEHWFYYDINPFYVDTLDKKVTEKFIESVYEVYREKFGNRIEGFFTDEPQISRNGIPWSFAFADEYRKKYGEDINLQLEKLFLPIDDYKQVRIRFWKMVTDMFSENFMKTIYDWCEKWGYRLTGHLVIEEFVFNQLTPNGACMPHYEYFHIPGMDWLGRNIFDCLTPMQVSSVCDQLGKKQVISETFALCGHNVSFAELKGIYEWQMVHGINLLCQHLEGYSIRGIRKRDYPPAMYCQQPWWSEYRAFVDAMSRESMVLCDADKKADVLLIHPESTAWAMFAGGDISPELEKLNADFLMTIKELEKKHVMFHLGDETILERHARVENGRLIVGEQSYSKVIASVGSELFDNTKKLLEEFTKSGGEIISADELNANDVCDNEEISYLTKSNDEYTVHYFVNTSAERKSAKINVSGKKLDIYTGELEDFCDNYEFEPWGSLMVIEGKADISASKKPDFIKPDGKFKLCEHTLNALTLDHCDYYFDGELIEKNGYVLNIAERANELERKVKIHQDYHVKADYVPHELYLVCETPEKFKISINGEPALADVCGYFVDKSFKKLEISKYLKVGDNTVSFDCDFVQSDEFYENRRKAFIFESEKNKLAYDFEIEAIYLLGDFSVRTDGTWESLEKKAERYRGDFVIDAPKTYVDIKDIQRQGYPFFCGEMTLEGEIDIAGENPVLEFDTMGLNAVRVEIGNTKKVMLTDNRLALADFGVRGRVPVRLTLVNNLRNLLGPHHLKAGESYAVSPASFFKEACIWSRRAPENWDDGYVFVRFGI